MLPLISCHHGDINHQNNLGAAEALIERFPEIDVFEIDFISLSDEIISSHDYDINVICHGSRLEEWVASVVIKSKKILWLDVKENLGIYCACQFERFDYKLLFRKLKKIRESTGMDITPYVWIGCQDVTLRHKIFKRNKRLTQPWQLMLDMPTVSGYVAQRLMPQWARCYLRDWVCDDFRETPYEHFAVLSIDQSFFLTRDEIKQFIKSLKVSPQTIIVVNSFSRDVRPLKVNNCRVVMQYDYTLEQQ